MEVNDNIFFCSHKGQYGIYSQWYPVKFVEKRQSGIMVEYQNAEQYMMAQKALLFKDYEALGQIMKTDDPRTVKELGGQIKGFNQQIWDEHKLAIVREGNRLKFKQNPDLKRQLLETGSRKLVEAADYDKIWGIGLNAKDAMNTPEDKWPGKNLLGKALMEVRYLLQ